MICSMPLPLFWHVQSDSIEGIYDTLKECAAISKSAGGIGLSIHNIRGTVRLKPYQPHALYRLITNKRNSDRLTRQCLQLNRV